MTSQITIKGLDKLQGKIDDITSLRAIQAGIKAGALHVKGKIAQYPPASDANVAGPYPKRWYQRGYGPRWARKSGGVGGRKTSETLGRKWTISQSYSEVSWAVGNNVSYGPFVQGAKEQAAFHKTRGWKDTDQVAEEERERVVGFVKEHIDKILNK
jgi:hypothetical protein